MKKCPYCAEEIQDEAIKCKHCGEFLNATLRTSQSKNLKWYFRKSFIIIALGSVGPLALPLIWWRPNTSRRWKVGLTIIVLALSWILFAASLESIRKVSEYYKLLDAM